MLMLFFTEKQEIRVFEPYIIYSLPKVILVIYINTHIDSKYIAKDLISIHEVLKKLLQCARFGECAFCEDIVRAFLDIAIFRRLF